MTLITDYSIALLPVRHDILKQLDLPEQGYALATLHRASNVDDASRLADLFSVLNEVAEHLPVVFPVHPRTHRRISELKLPCSRVNLIPPQSYLDFLRLMSAARLVLTDSGGVQEETTVLQVPCLTMRENTERPATIGKGTNQLVGVEPGTILAAVRQVLRVGMPAGRIPEFWDGGAAKRIFDILEEKLAADLPGAGIACRAFPGDLKTAGNPARAGLHEWRQ